MLSDGDAIITTIVVSMWFVCLFLEPFVAVLCVSVGADRHQDTRAYAVRMMC